MRNDWNGNVIELHCTGVIKSCHLAFVVSVRCAEMTINCICCYANWYRKQSRHCTATFATKLQLPNSYVLTETGHSLGGGFCTVDLDYYRFNNGLCPYTRSLPGGGGWGAVAGRRFLYIHCDLQPLQPWPLRQGRTSLQKLVNVFLKHS